MEETSHKISWRKKRRVRQNKVNGTKFCKAHVKYKMIKENQNIIVSRSQK